MSDHFGSCLCGTAKFQVQGEFDSFYLCHCQHCQKDTGSSHAANLFSQSAKLIWLAGADVVTTFALPDTRHTKIAHYMHFSRNKLIAFGCSVIQLGRSSASFRIEI